MKLLRYGPKGAEKPGLLDAEGNIRDLSGHVADITGAQLSPASLKAWPPSTRPRCRWSKARPATACRSTASRKFIAVGLNFADHAAESNLPIPAEPIFFTKAVSCLTGPNDNGDDPARFGRPTGKSSWAS
jgi:2,4-diketo-3-deoxy-L-fuconate hydrolase